MCVMLTPSVWEGGEGRGEGGRGEERGGGEGRENGGFVANK